MLTSISSSILLLRPTPGCSFDCQQFRLSMQMSLKLCLRPAVQDIQRDTGFAVMSTMRGAPAPNAPEGKSVVENKKGTLIDFKPPALAKSVQASLLLSLLLVYSMM